MKRRDAINLLYKIYNACQDVTINSIKIEETEKTKDTYDQDFFLVINSSVSPTSKSILRNMAADHGLFLSEKSNRTIISNHKNL